jgi:hypothetical protein
MRECISCLHVIRERGRWFTLPFGNAKGEREGFAYVLQANRQI